MARQFDEASRPEVRIRIPDREARDVPRKEFEEESRGKSGGECRRKGAVSVILMLQVRCCLCVAAS